MCDYPVTIKHENGMPQRVSCGQCISCRIQRARMWSLRCMDEVKFHDSSIFITLTYSPEQIPEFGSLSKKHLQDYFKRLRKADLKFRYFACGEYGDLNQRPHYHAIMFGLSIDNIQILTDKWHHGHIQIGSVTIQSTNYVARYTQKKQQIKPKEYYDDLNIIPEFQLISSRPAIGLKYFEQYGKADIERGYKYTEGGDKHAIPRYYKKKYIEKNGKISNFRTYLDSIEQSRDYDKKQMEFDRQRLEQNKSCVEFCRERDSQRLINIKQR